MFVHDNSLAKVDARPSDIITLLVSTNRPLVALSGPPQQADAFIVSVGRGKTQPVYLCFYIIKEGQRLVYTSNTVPTSQNARTRLEEEALRFVEDMGFMMVRERFDELSPEQREDTIKGLAPFVDDISDIRYDEKRDKKQKEQQAAAVARSVVEYEDVYEEVEEEVPIEEEPAKPEEYESLSDVVTEVSAHEEPKPAADDSGTTEQGQPPPPEAAAPETVDTPETAATDEQAFDLGRELSDVVETIGKMPEKQRTAQRARPERSLRPEPAEKRPNEPAPQAEPVMETLPEKQQAIVKLLITL